jgi:molybdopterin molybdotransferase
MITEDEARNKIVEAIQPLPSRKVALADALGSFSAREVLGTIPLPGFDNSAMDGYAISAKDLSKGKRLRVIAEQPAGVDKELSVKPGEAVRIFTGAPVPTGAAAVVMQEDVHREGDFLVLSLDSQEGEFIRRRGCDLAEGQEIVKAGQKITPAVAGLLASQGLVEIEVAGAVRAALISTGDEVVPPGSERRAGQIFESNSMLLAGLLRQLDVATMSIAHSPDDRETLRRAVVAAAGNDVLLITGGVSVGERDFVQEVLRSLGARIEIWRVAIKPGKPFLFGQLDRCFVFGLPGNPVSTFVTFLKLVRPAILKLMGANATAAALPQIRCELAEDVCNDGDRPHYLRGRYEAGRFTSLGRQESHALFGLSRCNALLRLEAGESVEGGSSVLVETWE